MIDQRVPVTMLPLPPGEDVDCLLPPELECPLVNITEVGEARVPVSHCVCLRVEIIETHITHQIHLVPENRIRCVLRDIQSGEKCYCWMFGDYSNNLVSMGVKTGDMVIIQNPRVVKTKLKYKQVLPEDMSPWTIHCMMKEKPVVTFIKVDARDEMNDVISSTSEDNDNINNDNDPAESAINALIEDINKGADSEFSSQPPVTSTQAEKAFPKPSPSIRKPLPSPIKQVTSGSSAAQPQISSASTQPRPQYTLLSNCKTHKQKYNVMAVLTHILETPRRRKSKIVAKLMISDESLLVAGDLREYFKFDILTDSMEQIPELQIGSVLRIHHMSVEVFNGKADGRVYSGSCVTTVQGGVGEPIVPSCPATRGTRDITWTGEDDKRVEQLRLMWAGQEVEVRKLEDIVTECVSRVTGRVMAVYTCGGHVILRLQDGTVSGIVSVEYRGSDTETMEEAGDNKQWVDVWCEHADPGVTNSLVDGDLVLLDLVRCAKLDNGVFRFLLDRGGEILRLDPEALEAVELKERLGPEASQSQNVSYIDRMLAAVSKQGSFVPPSDSDSLVASQQSSERQDQNDQQLPSSPSTQMDQCSQQDSSVLPASATKPTETMTFQEEVLQQVDSESQKKKENYQNSESSEAVSSQSLELSKSIEIVQDETSRNLSFSCKSKIVVESVVERTPTKRLSLKRSRSQTPPPTLKKRNKDGSEASVPRSPKVKRKRPLSGYSLRADSINESTLSLSLPDHPKSFGNSSKIKNVNKSKRCRSESPTTGSSQYSLRSRSQTPPISHQVTKENVSQPACSSPTPPSLPCAQPSPTIPSVSSLHDPPSPLSLSSLPCSQMSEFLADSSPQRIKPSSLLSTSSSPASSPRRVTKTSYQCSQQSSTQSSVFASCRGSPSHDVTECTLLQDSEEMEVSQKHLENIKDDNVDTQYSLCSESDFEMTMSMDISNTSPPVNSTLLTLHDDSFGEKLLSQNINEVVESGVETNQGQTAAHETEKEENIGAPDIRNINHEVEDFLDEEVINDDTPKVSKYDSLSKENCKEKGTNNSLLNDAASTAEKDDISVLAARGQKLLDSLDKMSQSLLAHIVTDDESEDTDDVEVICGETNIKDNANVHRDVNNMKDKRKKETNDNRRKSKRNKKGVSKDTIDKEEELTLGYYRSKLRVQVLSTCRQWPRVTCSGVSEADPGEYRLLCVVNKVRNLDNIIMGYCHLCGRMESPGKFTKSDDKLFCCSKTDPVKIKLHIVFDVLDHTLVSSDSLITVVVSGSHAERFLGLASTDWSLTEGVSQEVMDRVARLEGGVVELGVEKITQSSVLFALNTVANV